MSRWRPAANERASGQPSLLDGVLYSLLNGTHTRPLPLGIQTQQGLVPRGSRRGTSPSSDSRLSFSCAQPPGANRSKHGRTAAKGKYIERNKQADPTFSPLLTIAL
ncbi:hypothetical protein BJX62DRAFT_88372 [Aspergillus germanicus]